MNMLILWNDLNEEQCNQILKEKKSIQRKLTKRYKRTRTIAIIHAKNTGEEVIKCSICGKSILEAHLENLIEFDVHADLHSLDDREYLSEGNLHIICGRRCHNRYRIEKYRLSDGSVYEYEKYRKHKAIQVMA